jgi:hypothetical protein
MNFEHPSYVVIVTEKWPWSSIMEKKSKLFSIAVTISVELPSIVILMVLGIYILKDLKHFATKENDAI